MGAQDSNLYKGMVFWEASSEDIEIPPHHQYIYSLHLPIPLATYCLQHRARGFLQH